jgi:hypothetical protein
MPSLGWEDALQRLSSEPGFCLAITSNHKQGVTNKKVTIMLVKKRKSE